MRRIAEQTLTSCLLARKICRHAQREGRRKEEKSTNDTETKCERQEREVSGTLSFRRRRVKTAVTIKTSGREGIRSKTRFRRMAWREEEKKKKKLNYVNGSLLSELN